MAGLLSDVLPFVYSRADALKRRVGGLLSDPMGTLTQAVNDANDRAGGLLSQTRAATKEGLNYGPATQSLAQSIAAAYNPIGITVYHGSPHKFAKFDSSKIGTGEGAQAYGHGLYLAESPEVAGSYKATLSGRGDAAGAAAKHIPSRKFTGEELAAIHRAATGDDPIELAARRLGYRAASLRDVDERALSQTIADVRDQAQGSIYKVDLPDSAVARMLDWDKPLSQQAPEVRKAFEPLVAPIRKVEAQASGSEWGDLAAPRNYDPTGRELLQLLSTDKSMTPQNFLAGGVGPASSARAREMGIPGIRYLDGGSRGLGGGTSNFVVFPGEEGLLKILERNGAPVR